MFAKAAAAGADRAAVEQERHGQDAADDALVRGAVIPECPIVRIEVDVRYPDRHAFE